MPPLRLIITFLLITWVGFFKVEAKKSDFNATDSLLQDCIKHLDNYDNTKAFELMDEVDRLIPLETNRFTIADYYSVKSSLEGRRLNYEEQFGLLEKFNKQAIEIGDAEYIGNAFLGFASYYEHFSDFKKALPYFLKALDQFKKLNDEVRIAYLYNKLGLIYYADDDFLTAKNYFMASFVLFSRHKNELVVNEYWMQNALSNIGLCYKNLKLYRKSLSYLFMAYEFCKTAKFEKERPMSIIESNIGVVYGELNNFDKAIYYLKLGIKGSTDPKNEELNHGVESTIYLSAIYSKKGDFIEAERLLEEARVIIQNQNLNFPLVVYYEELAKLYYQKKDYKGAFLAKENYLRLNDSLERLDKKTIYGKQFLVHDLETQMMEIQILEKEKNLQTQEKMGFIGLAMASILIIFLVYRNLNKIRVQHQKLGDLNQLINEQKSKLSEANKHLEKLNQNKTYLLQSVAHDLRSPIGNIISLNGLLEAESEPDSEEIVFHKLIQNSCLLSLNIIEDILDQSMIERGKFQLKKTEADIQQLLEDSIKIIELRAHSKGIEIKRQYSQLPELLLDQDRIKRVFINILMNAIKFSPRNSVIEISEYVQSDRCIISIKDHGIGINDQMLSQIFDKNSNASREGTEKEGTIGIGLSITRSIVEGHNGIIRVESIPNSGSTFYIELPILDTNDAVLTF
ncbi:MAG: tetratricopeptide repeat-containing sensor histidine kinase [bacterium]|nr:tetratricopeptide repeat-containing sensor histidine kinase [bacterium]